MLKRKIIKAVIAQISSRPGGTKNLSSMIEQVEIAVEKRRYV